MSQLYQREGGGENIIMKDLTPFCDPFLCFTFCAFCAPVGQRWDEFFQQGPHASADFMAERATQVQPEREGLGC